MVAVSRGSVGETLTCPIGNEEELPVVGGVISNNFSQDTLKNSGQLVVPALFWPG